MLCRRSGLDKVFKSSWRSSVSVLGRRSWLNRVSKSSWRSSVSVFGRRSGLDRVTTCSWRGIVRPQTVWRSCPWAPQAWVLAYWRPFKITGVNSAKNKTHIPDIRFFGIYILRTYTFSPGATKSHLKFAIAHLYNRPHTSILYLSFYKLTVNVRPITPVDCLI